MGVENNNRLVDLRQDLLAVRLALGCLLAAALFFSLVSVGLPLPEQVHDVCHEVPFLQSQHTRHRTEQTNASGNEETTLCAQAQAKPKRFKPQQQKCSDAPPHPPFKCRHCHAHCSDPKAKRTKQKKTIKRTGFFLCSQAALIACSNICTTFVPSAAETKKNGICVGCFKTATKQTTTHNDKKNSNQTKVDIVCYSFEKVLCLSPTAAGTQARCCCSHKRAPCSRWGI